MCRENLFPTLVVTRLPFEVPDHPLVESRFESIRERGGNPFYGSHSVPVGHSGAAAGGRAADPHQERFRHGGDS